MKFEFRISSLEMGHGLASCERCLEIISPTPKPLKPFKMPISKVSGSGFIRTQSHPPELFLAYAKLARQRHAGPHRETETPPLHFHHDIWRALGEFPFINRCVPSDNADSHDHMAASRKLSIIAWQR